MGKKIKWKKIRNNSIRLFTPGLISNLEGYEQGEWWIQDYSSQIPVSLLEIQNNDDKADLCAAPGGNCTVNF